MSEGKGFARRVTLETLNEFAPLLGQKTKNTHEDDTANQEAASDSSDGGQKEADPALKNARAMFSGTSIRTKKPSRSASKGGRPAATRTPPQTQPSSSPPGAPSPAQAMPGQLLWLKQSLSRSDAQQTPAGTNPTGNLKLSQARFEVGGHRINQRTYFRNTVFPGLGWVRTSGTKEEASADFEVIIRGIHHGVHTLVLSHDPSREAGQNNTPTWLHWGDVGDIVRRQNVTGLALSLYAPPAGHPTPFRLEIG